MKTAISRAYSSAHPRWALPLTTGRCKWGGGKMRSVPPCACGLYPSPRQADHEHDSPRPLRSSWLNRPQNHESH